MKNFICAIFLLLPLASRSERPNILLILADDLGYADLGVQGCKQFGTPHIDAIAEKGVRFKQGYVSNSVCAPSRAGILSGRIGIGFEANLPEHSKDGLDPALPTMADVMRKAGYKTFCVGKWHLGYGSQFHPNQRGFDEFYGLLGGSRTYYADNAEKLAKEGKALERNGVVEEEPPGSYITDRLTDGAVAYLDGHLASDASQPFFMYLSYTAPHGPLEPKPGYAERFPEIKSEKRRAYAGLVASLDEGVGRMLECLRRNDALEKTLIVFLSDNGGPLEDNASYNGLLRGKKGSLWEGGVRVPFLIRWDGVVAAGQVKDEPVSSLDLLPTFETVAGVNARIKGDGVDLWPLLSGKMDGLAERGFYWRRGSKANCALRQGDYKWLENRRTDEQWLFNIKDDPSEKSNLLDQYPERAGEMRKMYADWERTIPDPAFESGWIPKKGK